MRQLGSFLKRYAGWIAVIVALLSIQAICDLALPDYTAKIVDVGISQNGIEYAVPEEIRVSEMKKVITFVPEAQKADILHSYQLFENGTQVTWEYDLNQLDADSSATLRLKEKADMESMNDTMARAISLVSLLESGSELGDTLSLEQQIRETLPPEYAQVPLMDLFMQMPQQEIDQFMKEFDESLAFLPENMLTSSATYYIRNEYEVLGRNIGKMQNRYIFNMGLRMLGIVSLAMACTIGVGLVASRVSAGYCRDIREGIFSRVMRFSSKEMDEFSTASLITRSTNDIQQIQMMMVMTLRMVFYAPLMGVGALLKVLARGSSMSWVIGLAVGLILGMVVVLFIVAMPKFQLLQKLVDRVNLVAREILTGLPVIRAFSTQNYEKKRFGKANADLKNVSLFVNRVMAIMFPTMMFIMNGITVLIVWVGSKNIDTGVIQIGDLMAFIQYAMHIIMSFLIICMMSIMIPRSWVSVKRIGEIFDQKISIFDPENPKQFIEDKTGYVEFQNVSYRYPGAEEDVLSQISFTAVPGQTVAFIGSTGSGKSTLVNLIPRFFDATEGKVLVCGRDVREVSQSDLRDKIGYIPQKGVLFSGTIDSNIRYGNESATKEQVRYAAEIAQAEEFINAKAEGYDSEISQGGGNVSGGQKQRLSIARAIAKNPDIYIFDDSFSALDFKTDVALRKALRRATESSTILIVAQRISTIVSADQIIVLDEGKIVGKGTHRELLGSCEVYQQIASSQLSKEELQ